MLKSVVLCVLLWHGICEFSSSAHPANADTRFLNLPARDLPTINDADLQIEPMMIYNIIFNITQLFQGPFSINGPLFGTGASTTALKTASTTTPTAAPTTTPTAASTTTPTAASTTASTTTPTTPTAAPTTTTTVASTTTPTAASTTAYTTTPTTTPTAAPTTTPTTTPTVASTTTPTTTPTVASTTTPTTTPTVASTTTPTASSTTSPAKIRPGSGYVAVNGFGAYKTYTEPRGWMLARQICIDDGGDLVVIRSDAEGMIVAKAVRANKLVSLFIGYRDENWISENGWMRWYLGRSLSGVGCAVYAVGNADIGMLKIPCDTRKPFICKRTTV